MNLNNNECKICFSELSETKRCCPCQKVFEDYKLYKFSTASVQVEYKTTFFDTIGSSREDVFGFFQYLQDKTKKDLPIDFKYSMSANRKNSKTKVKRKLTEHGNDHMYNSALLRKTYVDEKKNKEFRTSCLIFKSRLIITLGSYNLREKVFSDYLTILKKGLSNFGFQVLKVSNVLTNASFTGCKGPPPVPMKVTNIASLHPPPFDLTKTFSLLQPLYKSSERIILFNPVITDTNKIQIILLENGKKKGKISIFKSGTAMFLGFKTLAAILEEYGKIRAVLKENGYKMMAVNE